MANSIEHFPHRLRISMAYADMSGVDLSKATGTPQSRISDFLNGKKLPTIENAIDIANCLGVSLDVLFSDKLPEKLCA